MATKETNEIPAGIENHDIDINGHKGHYLKAGSGPPVVLVHGGASDSRDWISAMTSLSHRFTLYAPDLIGFGQSERNEQGYYLSDFSDFLIGFFDSLLLYQVPVVGHSFGARVCLEAALQDRERISELVLVDAAGLGKVSAFGNIMLAGFWFLRKILRYRDPYPKFLTREGEDDNWLCVNELNTLNTKTLLVWKSLDPYLSVSLARRAVEKMPQARLVIVPGFGHAPHKQNPGIFQQLLLEFLENK